MAGRGIRMGLVVAGVALAAAAIDAQKTQATTVPVTTIISDYDTGVAPSLQFRSDGGGWYQSSSTLKSFIYKGGGSDGGFQLDAYYVRNATRKVYLGFDYPVPGSGPSPVPSGYYKAIVNSACYRWGNSFWTVAPGTSVQCPFNVRFDYGGKSYHVHMNNRNWSETDPVTVTCIYPSSGSGPCSQWSIKPSRIMPNPDGSVSYRNVAALHEEVTVKGSTTLINRGDFYFSFMVLVTNP